MTEGSNAGVRIRIAAACSIGTSRTIPSRASLMSTGLPSAHAEQRIRTAAHERRARFIVLHKDEVGSLKPEVLGHSQERLKLSSAGRQRDPLASQSGEGTDGRFLAHQQLKSVTEQIRYQPRRPALRYIRLRGGKIHFAF